jgi:hypothetical protein
LALKSFGTLASTIKEKSGYDTIIVFPLVLVTAFCFGYVFMSSSKSTTAGTTASKTPIVKDSSKKQASQNIPVADPSTLHKLSTVPTPQESDSMGTDTSAPSSAAAAADNSAVAASQAAPSAATPPSTATPQPSTSGAASLQSATPNNSSSRVSPGRPLTVIWNQLFRKLY